MPERAVTDITPAEKATQAQPGVLDVIRKVQNAFKRLLDDRPERKFSNTRARMNWGLYRTRQLTKAKERRRRRNKAARLMRRKQRQRRRR